MATTDPVTTDPSPTNATAAAAAISDNSGGETACNEKASDTSDISQPTPTDKESAEKSAPAPERSITGLKWFFCYSSLLSTVFLFALDGTIVASLQASVVDTFQTENDLAWIGVGFMLGNCAILPLGNAFGSFNTKWMFIVNLILFEIGSALCGAAPTMPALIVGRVIAGVGGCGIYAGGLMYVSMLTTNHERPLYLAGIYSIWGVGCVLGPIVGGSFGQSSATWRWGFYINLPIAALFAPCYILCLPSIDPSPNSTLAQKLRAQDWLGSTIFLAGCTCFAMAINFGGAVYEWNSGSEIALLVLTGLLLIAFVAVTIYHPGIPEEHKLLPVSFMRTLDLIILPIQSAIVAGAMFTTIYYTPLLFQFTKGDGPLDGGVRILPLISMLVFFALLNAALMPKLGYYMPWYVFGNAAILVGSSLMLTMKSTTSASSIYGFTILIGVGVGCFQSAGVAVASAIAPASEVNRAVSVMTIAQILGSLAALSITGCIFQNTVLVKVGAVLPDIPRDQVSQFLTGTSGHIFGTLTEERKLAVVAALTGSVRNAFVYVVATSALGFALSLALKRKKLYLADGQVAN